MTPALDPKQIITEGGFAPPRVIRMVRSGRVAALSPQPNVGGLKPPKLNLHYFIKIYVL